MNCPKCNTPLKTTVYEGVEIDKCGKCKGTWLDDGEIIKILQSREEPFDPKLIRETLAQGFTGIPKDEQHNVVKCPNCQSVMEPINYNYSSGIILDRCPEGHGLWLDSLELEKVQIEREQSEEDFLRSKEDWIALAKSGLSDKDKIGDENRKRSLRPTKYLANCLIRKIVGN
ncbi:MAG: zf-TFIIB domain-containing protein [Phycisphaerae bacterium]|jgi:Zn-finger nucleic acid-binding protein